ncbi:MAG: ELM1/GtrOC1 family putative glycosyltransferase, partial [Candidatus Omnitrophota bacterium]
QWLWSHKRWKSTPQRTVIILGDGKAGHFNQATAVAEMIEEALGFRLKARGIEEKPIVKIHAVDVRFKNNFTKMFLNLASIFASRRCQGCLRCLKLCLTKESYEAVKNKYADIVISCGASTVAANIFLKYENNAKNVLMMKPGFGCGRKIDLIILPRHDAITVGNGFKLFPAPNILVTEGAPNRINDKLMEITINKLPLDLARGRQIPNQGGIGVLIGGDAKGFRLEKSDVERVLDAVIKISEGKNIDIYASTSRRTSAEIDKLIKEKLSGRKNCKLLIIANEKNIEGAVPGIFGLSDVIVTSPESMSMISEAASSGKSTIVFRVAPRRCSGQAGKGLRVNEKYNSMISSLEEQGYIHTATPDGIYNKIKEILETRPGVRRLNDREKIAERLKGLI